MISRTDFVHDIITVYTKPKYNYDNLYRYVSINEFKNLFDKHFLMLTNPKNWVSTDIYETYFEEWWLSKEHLREIYYKVKKAYQGLNNRMSTRYGEDWNCECNNKSTFIDIVARASLLQQKTFCYCVTESFNNPKIINEYHDKWERKVVLKYKPNCFQNISLFEDPKLATVLASPYLSADFFPMVYVRNFEEFISSILPEDKLPNWKNISEKLLETGIFLKHSKFAYEHEIRFRLRVDDPKVINSIIIRNTYDKLYDIDDEEKFLEECIIILEEYKKKFNAIYKQVADQIHPDGKKEYFRLRLENSSIKNLIDKIYVFNDIDNGDLSMIMDYGRSYGIPVMKYNPKTSFITHIS